MHPSEFWDSTIAEVAEFISERSKGDLTTAWRHAVLTQSGKLPKTPEELWSEPKHNVIPLDAMLAAIVTPDKPRKT